jgi:hypothetical protein
LLLSKVMFPGQPASMIIKVVDHTSMRSTETICVRTTYRTCQFPVNAPTSKNVVCLEIMDRPQVNGSKIKFLLFVTVIRFNSYPQQFQLFNQWFQHHIYSWTRNFWTRYDETKEHELKLQKVTKLLLCDLRHHFLTILDHNFDKP